MKRLLLIPLISLLIPASAFAVDSAATFSVARSLVSASSSPGNAYDAGISVVVTAPVAGDLAAVGGGVVVAAPVSGDELLIAGSISSRAQVLGDLRALGGSIMVEKPVGGDLAAFGLSVYDAGRVGGSVFVIALNTTLVGGAAGPVTVYGNNVLLAGDFSGDVTITASGRLALEPGTKIRGKLSYEAPEPAVIPASATVGGGITYNNISYLPDVGTSRALAFISVGFFLFIRILGALLLAGLLAGLFPRLAEMVTEQAYTTRLRDILLTMLLGFAILVATPILFILLLLTFVGFGIALLIFILYVLMVCLALLYAGILLGSLFARRFLKREAVRWHDGVLGMLVFSLIALVPIVGLLAVALLTSFSAGALLTIFFNLAFPREKSLN